MEYTVQSPTGETRVIDGPEGATDAEISAAAQNLFGQSALESGLRGAVNNLPAGGQLGALGTAAMKGTDYSQGMTDFNKSITEAKAEHPIAYGAGAVGGTLAPLAIPGVGEALKAAPMASSAALGALSAAGNTDVLKNPELAAKQGLEGGITGVVLGKILPTGEKAQEGLESLANRKAVQASGIAAGNLGVPGEKIQDMGTMLHELGADTGSMEEKYNTIKDALSQTGKQQEELGIGKVLQNPTSIMQDLQQHMMESIQTLGAEGNPEVKMYQQAMQRITPNTPFETLADLKQVYGNRAFDKFGGIKSDPAFNIYHSISDAMDQLTENQPEYQQLKQTYSTLKDMKEGIEKQFQNEQAGQGRAGGIGMMGRMAGMITGGNVPATATAAGLSAATGHPLWALSLGSSLATNPGAVAGAARAGAEAVPGIAAAAKLGGVNGMVSHFINNMQSYGKFSAPLSQALQSGGSQQFAATSFVLRQQHPELNDIMLQHQEQTDNAQ